MAEKQKVTEEIKIDNNLEILRKYFPNCFNKEGNFNFEKFKKEIKINEINLSKESYELEWLGKSYARVLTFEPARTLLKTDEEWNNKPENKNSGNILIKGDNLEVLKHLGNAYHEKIKMIYIDPPYNTGNDGFVYQDDRKFTVEELAELAGIDEERAKRILDFVNSKSNSHSAWLTFMYPRLYIARRLLREDGVIFVSIDDNEQAQLKLLMDEIFGEENFISMISVKVRDSAGESGGGEDKKLKKNIEYLLLYAKNRNEFILPKIYNYKSLRHELLIRNLSGKNFGYNQVLVDKSGEKLIKSIKDGAGDEIKIYTFDRVEFKTISALTKERKIDEYEVYKKYYDKIFTTYNARTSIRDRIKEATRDFDGLIKIEYMPKTGKYKNQLTEKYFYGKTKRLLSWLNEVSKKDSNGNIYIKEELGTLWININWGKIANEGNVPFDNGKKPVDFIKLQIKIASAYSGDIILDFFAGSGTTGDAVMQLNAEDGGNRKFILVQLDEPIDEKKTAYNFVKNELGEENPTIFHICKERLVRAVKKIKEEIINKKIEEREKEIKELESKLDVNGDNKEKIEKLKQEIEALKNQDLGFKVFETIPIWEDYLRDEKELTEQTTLFDESKLTEEDLKALLITWKTYDGLSLTEECEEVKLNDYTAYYCGGNLYLLHTNWKTENIKALLEKIDREKDFVVDKIIVFGYNFNSKDLREIEENIKNYSNKKQIEIETILRF